MAKTGLLNIPMPPNEGDGLALHDKENDKLRTMTGNVTLSADGDEIQVGGSHDVTTEGHIPLKKGDEFVDSAIMETPTEVFITKTLKATPGSVKMGPITMSERGGYLQTHTDTTGRDFVSLDYQISDAGTERPTYDEREALVVRDVKQPTFDTEMIGVTGYNVYPPEDADIIAVYFKLVNPVTNFRYKAISEVTGLPVMYYPSELDWINGTGASLPAGEVRVELPTPLAELENASLTVEMVADQSIDMLGDGANLWRAVDKQAITYHNLALEGESVGPEFMDDVFRIDNVDDPTKKARFIASDIPTGTTREYMLPGEGGELVTDLPTHSVEELNDISSAGSGSIITTAERNKLFGIETGAQANVMSDWVATTGDAYILNKPSDVTDLSVHSVTELNDVTDAGSGEIITAEERAKIGTGGGKLQYKILSDSYQVTNDDAMVLILDTTEDITLTLPNEPVEGQRHLFYVEDNTNKIDVVSANPLNPIGNVVKVQPANLQGHWPLSGIYTDGSGKGHDVIKEGTGGGFTTMPVLGKVVTAYRTDGTSYLRAAGYKGVLGGTPRTVSFWFAYDGLTPPDVRRFLFQWGLDTTGTPYWGVTVRGDQSPQNVRVDARTAWKRYDFDNPGIIKLFDGNPHCVQIVQTGAGVGSANMYIDGALLVKDAQDNSPNANTREGADLRIGASIQASLPDAIIDGAFYDFRVWDVALSDLELYTVRTENIAGGVNIAAVNPRTVVEFTFDGNEWLFTDGVFAEILTIHQDIAGLSQVAHTGDYDDLTIRPLDTYTDVNGNYIMDDQDHQLMVDSNQGDFTVTLPPDPEYGQKHVFYMKDNSNIVNVVPAVGGAPIGNPVKVQPANLQGHWPLNGVLDDISGNNRPFSLIGSGGTFEPDTILGKSVTMFNTNGLQFPRAAGYTGVTGTTPRTVAFWFKQTLPVPTSSLYLINWGSNDAGSGLWWGVFMKYPDNQIMINAKGMYQIYSLTDPDVAVLLDGEPHHIAFTQSDAALTSVKLYVDGKLIARYEVEPANFINTKPEYSFTVARNMTGGTVAPGSFYDMRLWDVALAPLEVEVVMAENIEGGINVSALDNNTIFEFVFDGTSWVLGDAIFMRLLDVYQGLAGLAEVARSGDYEDLSNKPTVGDTLEAHTIIPANTQGWYRISSSDPEEIVTINSNYEMIFRKGGGKRQVVQFAIAAAASFEQEVPTFNLIASHDAYPPAPIVAIRIVSDIADFSSFDYHVEVRLETGVEEGEIDLRIYDRGLDDNQSIVQFTPQPDIPVAPRGVRIQWQILDHKHSWSDYLALSKDGFLRYGMVNGWIPRMDLPHLPFSFYSQSKPGHQITQKDDANALPGVTLSESQLSNSGMINWLNQAAEGEIHVIHDIVNQNVIIDINQTGENNRVFRLVKEGWYEWNLSFIFELGFVGGTGGARLVRLDSTNKVIEIICSFENDEIKRANASVSFSGYYNEGDGICLIKTSGGVDLLVRSPNYQLKWQGIVGELVYG